MEPLVHIFVLCKAMGVQNHGSPYEDVIKRDKI